MTLKTKFYLYFIAISLLPIPIVAGFVTHNILFLLFLLAYMALYFLARKDFLLPFSKLQNWVQNYKTDQSVRLEDKQKTSFQPVALAINHLIDENQHLYDDMEDILHKQIQRLSKKSASLETLYGVSSKLNHLHSTEALFTHFLDVFMNMTLASSGVARRLNNEDELHLIAQQGMTDAEGQMTNVRVRDCVCGDVAMAADAGVQFSVHTCEQCVGAKIKPKTHVGMIIIPLRYHNKTLGVFNLFFDTEPSLAVDERALLESMADNIAIALDKVRLDEETKRLALSQERLFLSQEIHDSLAQTIYSFKLQVTVLDDMLKQRAWTDASAKITSLQTHITQANLELRELMSNFRIPLDVKGIEASLTNLVDQFKTEQGIATYLQIEGELQLSAEVEMQIIRITQEALSNIRKHAKARNVRVFLLAKPDCQLLIEDDGIGFEKDACEHAVMGNNIGLRIMQERADSIGAHLKIESELTEGTRVRVSFSAEDNL